MLLPPALLCVRQPGGADGEGKGQSAALFQAQKVLPAEGENSPRRGDGTRGGRPGSETEIREKGQGMDTGISGLWSTAGLLALGIGIGIGDGDGETETPGIAVEGIR